MLDLDDRLLGIRNVEVQDRVDLERHVVARDQILARNLHHDRAQIDAHHLLDRGNQEDQPRAADAGETAEGEHDGPLVLAQDLDRRVGEKYEDDYDQQGHEVRGERH
jgi:hypothetical protein